MCFSMMKEYQAEMGMLQSTLPSLKTQYREVLSTINDIEQWTERIFDYLEVNQLTRALARNLIEKITVSEKSVIDGQEFRDITIIYKFVDELSEFSGKTKDVA